MSKDFFEVIAARRTRYSIDNKVSITQARVQEILEIALKNTPTSFNSQGGRLVLLFGEHNQKLWDIVKNTLKAIVPADKFAPTEKKINSFAAGFGAILFFEDQSVVEKLKTQLPTYKDSFEPWAQQSSGMLQYVIWAAFTAEGLGASLQHYNPLIDAEVAKVFNLPKEWRLIAQMPFGNPTAEPFNKVQQPIETRLKVFK
ncbi:MAG: nitroreductase family protein [Elusimicrobiota bacterium]|nr:nitroreductase family protein [Elusimicrobiota bacterium]